MTREEEIKEVARIRANQYSHPVEWNDCYKHWIEGAKWADETIINKAEEWLNLNLKMLLKIFNVEYDVKDDIDIKDFINDFKTAMIK